MSELKQYVEDRFHDYVLGNYDYVDYQLWIRRAKVAFAQAQGDETFTRFERARLNLIRRMESDIEATVASINPDGKATWYMDVIEAAFNEINVYDTANAIMELAGLDENMTANYGGGKE